LDVVRKLSRRQEAEVRIKGIGRDKEKQASFLVASRNMINDKNGNNFYSSVPASLSARVAI